MVDRIFRHAPSFEELPAILLGQPLSIVDCRLGAEGLRQDEKITRAPIVRPDVLIFAAHDVGHASNHWPRVHYTLASGDACSSFLGTVVEASHHFARDDLSVILAHLERDAEDHEHVVDAAEAHRIDVREHVAAGDAPLHVRVFDQGIEEVGRRDQFSLLEHLLLFVGGLRTDFEVCDRAIWRLFGYRAVSNTL